jgi:hypothetical protein
MLKTSNEDLFTTIRVLKKSLHKLQEINEQDVIEKQETIPQWKTFDQIVNNYRKTVKK